MALAALCSIGTLRFKFLNLHQVTLGLLRLCVPLGTLRVQAHQKSSVARCESRLIRLCVRLRCLSSSTTHEYFEDFRTAARDSRGALRGVIHSRLVRSLAASLPMAPKMTMKAKAKKAMRRTKKDLPFSSTPSPRRLMTMKEKQQSWLLAGLRHLGAPVELWQT